MSRCRVCDVILNDFELTFKYPGTTEFADTCMSCYSNEDIHDYDLDSNDITQDHEL